MLWFKCDEIIPGVAIGILVIAICMGFTLVSLEYSDTVEDSVYRMAEGVETEYDSFRAQNHSVFLLGYTGEVGKAILKEMACLKLFKKVTLIGRRGVVLGPEFGPEFEQKVVDFEKLDEFVDVFKDHSIGISCLGTTRGKSGAKGFVRVDHDYVLSAAELAKSVGCSHFNLVSSMSANKNAFFLYPRTKGQVEDALKVIHFDRTSIFRPGVLLCDREESRPGEAFIRSFLKPVAYFFPTAISTPTDVVARAILNNIVAKSENKVEMYENKAIFALAGTKTCAENKNETEEGQKEK
ncbi:hypothetical protein ScPMuIL_015251 [Solemya velum]